MINPEEFHNNEDQLTPQRRARMWQRIEGEIDQKGKLFFIPDRRSFVYGIAASILLYFAGTGIISTIRSAAADARPDVIRFDEAYRSAIQQFEHVVPAVDSRTGGDQRSADYVSARKEQLQKLNLAIDEMRTEMRAGDLSQLKQKRLRQLYGLKLQVLQEMIENGEIDL